MGEVLMMLNRNTSVIALLGSLFGLALSPSFAVAQQPNPPTLCIEGSVDCGLVAGGIKWNPGHYLKTQGNYAQGDIADYISSITAP